MMTGAVEAETLVGGQDGVASKRYEDVDRGDAVRDCLAALEENLQHEDCTAYEQPEDDRERGKLHLGRKPPLL